VAAPAPPLPVVTARQAALRVRLMVLRAPEDGLVPGRVGLFAAVAS